MTKHNLPLATIRRMRLPEFLWWYETFVEYAKGQ